MPNTPSQQTSPSEASSSRSLTWSALQADIDEARDQKRYIGDILVVGYSKAYVAALESALSTRQERTGGLIDVQPEEREATDAISKV